MTQAKQNKPAWRNWQRNRLVSRRLQVRFLPSALGQGMHFRYIPTPEMELDHYWSGSTHCSLRTETGRSCTRYTMMRCDDPHQMQDLQVQKSISARNHGTVKRGAFFLFPKMWICIHASAYLGPFPTYWFYSAQSYSVLKKSTPKSAIYRICINLTVFSCPICVNNPTVFSIR